jgi:hypothetical protein
LIPNPILKVLSTMAKHEVRALLMGGQACVFYGAAEFSRDTDLAVLANADNWARLQAALAELQAGCIAVPPCDIQFLHRGFALHFRCQHPQAKDMRIDVMSVMRGVAPFAELWERRVSLQDEQSGAIYELLALPDLVQAKKTQRSKDWPMIQRLLEADYLQSHRSPEKLPFWLHELRTAKYLIQLAGENREIASQLSSRRPLLKYAMAADTESLNNALEEEQRIEREKDRAYWEPLKKELEQLRHRST